MNLARTTLRNIIGTLTLKSANSERGKINTDLQMTMRDETAHWGIEIARTELKEIDPPKDVQETMNKVVKAENEKVAAVDFATATETMADGARRAEIKKAEGIKQAKILEAEGEAQAMLLGMGAGIVASRLGAQGNAIGAAVGARSVCCRLADEIGASVPRFGLLAEPGSEKGWSHVIPSSLSDHLTAQYITALGACGAGKRACGP